MELFKDDQRANYWMCDLLMNVFDCEDDDPPLPPPLTRQSNERYLYFGLYPYTCARIVTRRIFNHIKQDKYAIEEPVAGTQTKDFRVIKADVISKIYTIYCYLEKLGLVWNKDKNVITIEIGEERSVLEMFVCDDSGMFRILVEEPGPNTKKIIDCLQILFRDPASI